jgi:hypothetical protein
VSARLLRLAVPTLALALGAALAVALVSCGGGDDEGLLPGDDAQQIVENLNQVELDVANGDCDAAAENAAEVGDQIDALGGDVNAELKERLEEGASELEQLISTDCVEATATITTTEETTTEEPTTEETTTGKQKTDTTTTDTTTTDTTTTTTIPTTTSQTTTGGGVTAPSPEEDD